MKKMTMTILTRETMKTTKPSRLRRMDQWRGRVG